jgi:hypothetical protein
VKEIIEKKQQLRKIFHEKRSSIKPETKDLLSKLIAENLISSYRIMIGLTVGLKLTANQIYERCRR